MYKFKKFGVYCLFHILIEIEFWIYESECEYNVINKIYGLVSKQAHVC